jgi:hypothetical protein
MLRNRGQKSSELTVIGKAEGTGTMIRFKADPTILEVTEFSYGILRAVTRSRQPASLAATSSPAPTWMSSGTSRDPSAIRRTRSSSTNGSAGSGCASPRHSPIRTLQLPQTTLPLVDRGGPAVAGQDERQQQEQAAVLEHPLRMRAPCGDAPLEHAGEHRPPVATAGDHLDEHLPVVGEAPRLIDQVLRGQRGCHREERGEAGKHGATIARPSLSRVAVAAPDDPWFSSSPSVRTRSPRDGTGRATRSVAVEPRPLRASAPTWAREGRFPRVP